MGGLGAAVGGRSGAEGEAAPRDAQDPGGRGGPGSGAKNGRAFRTGTAGS